jgi:NADPH-dependent 2,4-dienoyl-CoA reductase/sulfur reductase-like enzyme/peroxiredoxin family protein/rhodanese-related sulfurtransferase/TusA-related sulfurtransferase
MPEPKRVLIVGGVAGGASAAARARRLSETAEIVLFERGPHISFANCGMPYHIGGAIADRDRLLVQTPDGMRRRYRLDVRTRTEVLRIDRAGRKVLVRNLETGRESEEPYDVLILSPGAEPVRPPIPGAEGPRVLTLRGLQDMDRIKHLVDTEKPERAVIVGGGYIGLEMTEALRRRGLAVTLVELARQVFIAADPEMAAPLHQHLQAQGVDLQLGTSVTAIQEEGSRLAVRLSSGETVSCGLVILAVGVRPEVRLAREAGLPVGPSGGIIVDEHMRTADPAVFAVGDAVEVPHRVDGRRVVLPLAGPANRQGRVAADNAFGRPSVYRGSQGTAICKVFDLALGMTGLSEKALRAAGRPYEKIYIHPASHAGYYPGAAPMSLKLLFDPTTGQVLGGQAVGAEGVDKRIDVLAVALRAGLTVQDLRDQELSYAPPYGSAKDPINYAGFVASNVMSGDMPVCHTEDVAHPRDDQFLLDVRTPAEVAAGTLPGAVNIPVDDLRRRLAEVPRDKEILAFCQVGLRGYLACRTLAQNGFRCRNLTGGYKTYKGAIGMLPPDEPPAREATRDACEEDTCDPATPPPAAQPPAPQGEVKARAALEIDARGLQCPGPILRLRDEMEKIETGQAVAILSSEPGFPADVAAWCRSTGHELAGVAAEGRVFRATIIKRTRPAAGGAAAPRSGERDKQKTLVVFSGDFDKAMAAMIIANGAASMGSRVTMFFTFWGLNVLRRPEAVKVRKNLIERCFGWMMPRGAGRLALSKMNFGGLGARMIKGLMRKKNVAGLPDLIESARRAGVRLVACSMSMDLMGLRREELIDGVEEGGVAMYLGAAEQGNVNLFI